MKYSVEQIKGKKISQLIEEGILPSTMQELNKIENSEYISIIEATDAYANNIDRLTSTPLKGSEKQVEWATKIRVKAAQQVALNMTRNLHIVKMGVSDMDYNKYARTTIAEFVDDRAAYYIDNRFNLV